MWESLQHEFYRYFVDNGASSWWLNGIKTTILVTLLALLIGVILGFLVAIIRSTHEQTGKLKLLNIICKIYLTVIRGTPSMIQILIFLFYCFCQCFPEQYRYRRNCLWYQLRSLCGGNCPFRHYVYR